MGEHSKQGEPAKVPAPIPPLNRIIAEGMQAGLEERDLVLRVRAFDR